MKVLVTGASGQLGKALLASVPEGWECRGLDRAALDLADHVQIARLVRAERPDLVINAGAFTAVDRAEQEVELAMAVNAEAPGAFARSLADHGGRLLQVSTDFVFDGQAKRPYLPNDIRNPLSVYGRSKALGEDASGDESIILRTSWIYAAGGHNFVRTMLRLMREQDELRVVNDQVGSPSWAPEAARTIWALAAADSPGTYHHRDAGETSWYGFATAIAEEAQALGLVPRLPAVHPISTDQHPTPARRPAFSVLDDSATRELLGDSTDHWRENLRRMLVEELHLAEGYALLPKPGRQQEAK
ncbi:MAG: dTDP-4-dehydrorhamnose reductase [Alphaproteobacteria bacterium]|nr:MAG: dTDP-4-dehydrorhamnose reductase [Alphaproteobacteria bacterium]